jgi:MFS family permease
MIEAEVEVAAGPVRAGSRLLLAGLVLAVTLIAFEATAVVTIMPTITDQLHGDSWYGAAFAAFMLANLVSIVVSGEQADRRGPVASFMIGVIGFGAGLLVAGSATTMPVFIAGRLLQGAGAGGLAATSYVGIGRGFPPARQPALFALLSAGWVLPSLVAPAAAGFVADHWGWRWVFLGLLPLVLALVVLALPALLRIGPGVAQLDPSRVPLALVLAVGAGMVVLGLESGSWILLIALGSVGLLIGIPALRRLLPAGTGRAARGEPAAVASRFLVNLAFFGADTFLPLAATKLHGASSTEAGLVIIGGALAWTGGAAMSARRRPARSARVVGAGFAFVAAGIAGAAMIVLPNFPLWAVFLLWAVAGFGIGAVFNTTSVAAMSTAPHGQEGLVASRLQIADALGFALASGIGGALVGVADRGNLELGAALAIVFLLAGVAALIGMVAARGVVQAEVEEMAERSTLAVQPG